MTCRNLSAAEVNDQRSAAQQTTEHLSNCVIGGRCAERNARSDWLNPYLTDRQIAVGSDMTNEMQLSATR